MLDALRVITALLVPLLVLVGMAGCGGTRPSPTVAHVGHAAISKRTLDHWTSVITRGAVVANVVDPEQPPRQQALALLINSDALIGEASQSGSRLSSRELVRMVKEQKDSTPGGLGEFKANLAASGETLPDVEFEARARWAAATFAQHLAQAVSARARAEVTSATVASFYRAHLAGYHRRERRYYDLMEQIPSRREAVARAKQVGSGERFAEKSSKERPFRPKSFRDLPGQAAAYKAVFAARRVGVVIGPVPLQGYWCLFVLRRIEPARVQSLAEVHHAIERRLLAKARSKVRTELVKAYRARWRARTDCRPGYVVQKCRQYTGRLGPEGEPSAGY